MKVMPPIFWSLVIFSTNVLGNDIKMIDAKPEYHFSASHQSTIDICKIDIALSAFPNSTTGKLSIFAYSKPDDKSMSFGFMFYQSELHIRNGMPLDAVPTPLASATITSNIFSSSNMTKINLQDEGVAYSVPSKDELETFLKMSFRGDYLLESYSAQGKNEVLFPVKTAVPPEIVKQFLSCSSALSSH